MKIYVDGAFHDESRHGGWGVICHDSDSDIQFMAAGPVNDLAHALHAEAMALLRGCNRQLCRDLMEYKCSI